MKSVAFVQKTFSKYYQGLLTLDGAVSRMDQREFGYVSFEGWMRRHTSFAGVKDLSSFLVHSTPRDTYVSAAYYENPEAQMEKKVWLGADIVFDIDADHIETPCDKLHDKWTCSSCGFDGRGGTPDKCPSCGGERFETGTWPCEACLNSARDETRKLLNMLMKDFGFSERELRVFFSGHRGYHVQIESTAIRDLEAMSRKEIVDYVTATGLGLGSRVRGRSDFARSVFQSKVEDVGWNGRIVTGLRNLVTNASFDELVQMGVHKNVANLLVKKRTASAEPIDYYRGIGPKTWDKLTGRAARDQSAKIDTVVTTDTHRLIRMPKSLHGKTGFIKTELSPSEISAYDPFFDAAPFNTGSVLVSVVDAPEFRLGDQTFGPYRNEKVELPISAAVLVACRNRGEVVDANV